MAQIPRPNLKYTKSRTINVIPSLEIELPEPTEVVIKEYEDLSELNRELGVIVEAIAQYAQAYLIPIAEEANDVRAASLRLGGDGKEITFANFRDAIEDQMANKRDLVISNYPGTGSANTASYNKSSFTRHSSGDDLSGTLEELSKYGMQTMILWALNQLVGMYHSMDHSEVTSGKYPPGVEVGGIFRQLLQALIMSRFIQGLSDKTLDELTSLNSTNLNSIGIDVDNLVDQAINSPPPESDSFKLFRHSMATSDHATIQKYSTEYMSKHFGEGFETWFGYLATRNAHEDNLRVEDLGAPYIGGQITFPAERREQLGKRNDSTRGMIDKVKSSLSGNFNTGDSCCLLRFTVSIDTNVLDIIRSIIATSIAVLENQAEEALSWYLSATSTPWNIISEKILRGLDTLFDKVIGEVLNVLDFDNDVMTILKACTPVSELVESVLGTIEYLRNWYHDLVGSIGKEIDSYFGSAAVEFEAIYGIRRAKQLLVALDEMIAFLENRGDDEEISEEDILSMVPVVEQSMNKYVLGPEEDRTPVGEFIDWCRTIGDWDSLKEKLSGSN